MRTCKSFDFIRWARELRSSPERPCELKDHPQTVTYYPTDLHPMSHHSDGPPCATCITHSALAGPTRTCATSREASRSSATARARADATQRALARAASLHQRPRSAGPQWRRQKRQLSRRASRERAEPRLSKEARAREGRIDRRVSSALPTSRAPRLAEEIVVVLDALAPSCLQLHLAITSRIDLLLQKGHVSAHMSV